MTISAERMRTANERDLLIITTPELWPAWPFLPVVRHQSNGETDYGVMLDCRNDPELKEHGRTVFLTNLFTLPHTHQEMLALPQEAHADLEALAASGWVVD